MLYSVCPSTQYWPTNTAKLLVLPFLVQDPRSSPAGRDVSCPWKAAESGEVGPCASVEYCARLQAAAGRSGFHYGKDQTDQTVHAIFNSETNECLRPTLLNGGSLTQPYAGGWGPDSVSSLEQPILFHVAALPATSLPKYGHDHRIKTPG